MDITLDYSHSFVSAGDLKAMEERVYDAHRLLHCKEGLGRECLGWLDYPENYDREEIKRIRIAAEKIRQDSEILLVIGVGGSYLGARAVIEALNHSFYNFLPKDKRRGPVVFFAGNNLSSKSITDLLEFIDGKDISINVVSKSGSTLEPIIAFRIFKSFMEEKYGKEGAKSRIYVTTGGKGILKEIADMEGYETFAVPNDIGGRYSVLTPVGLLPIAATGIDVDALLEGARKAKREYETMDLLKNPCYQYAAIRNLLYNRGKGIEVLISYEPCLHYFTEWWKQLFGESEGKDGKGIFPAGLDFTTDLHSLGQYLQDGVKSLFETTINIEKPNRDFHIPGDGENLDGLNYLEGKSMDYINKQAFQGTLQAHVEGGVPNIVINVPELKEYYMGQLIYFFEKACGMSGYILGVNPFNQPGVEYYKKNMYTLLGRPGY